MMKEATNIIIFKQKDMIYYGMKEIFIKNKIIKYIYFFHAIK